MGELFTIIFQAVGAGADLDAVVGLIVQATHIDDDEALEALVNMEPLEVCLEPDLVSGLEDDLTELDCFVEIEPGSIAECAVLEVGSEWYTLVNGPMLAVGMAINRVAGRL